MSRPSDFTQEKADPEIIRSQDGKFVPGKSANPAGKPKGTVNKTTALLKDAILLAARQAGGGGDEGMSLYLEKQARENPGPFMSLLGKVLPMQIAGTDAEGNPSEILIRVIKPDR